jgi:hypothetical protein
MQVRPIIAAWQIDTLVKETQLSHVKFQNATSLHSLETYAQCKAERGMM